MPRADFAANRQQAEADGLLGGGEFFKVKEGSNRIRLLSECLPHQSEFKGKKTFKWLCYVLDRKSGTVKPFFMAHTIYKALEALQTTPDYEFVDVPMPYDVTINAKGAGTIDVEYSIIPAKKETPLTPTELLDYENAKPLAELKQAIKDKQTKRAEQAQQPSDSLTDEDIPF